MSVLNVQNGVVFGFVTNQFYNLFQDTSGNTPGVGNVYNADASAGPWYTWEDYPYTMTTANAQAIEQLFPNINTGGNVIFQIANMFGPTTNTWPDPDNPIANGVQYSWPANSSYFYPFSDTNSDGTSIIQITAIGSTSNPIPQSNSTANISNSTIVSDASVPAAGASLTFTFLPGSTQTLQLSYATGATISNSVTNGVDNTTSSGTTQTVTTGVTASGELPFLSAITAEISSSFSQAWEQQQSQTISYSSSNETAVNTETTTTVTADLNTIKPDKQGNYIYTNSNGTSYTLVPGNQYVAQIEITQCNINTPVSNIFQLTGGNMSLQMYGYAETNQINPQNTDIIPKTTAYISWSPTTTYNVEQAISEANTNSYSVYSNVDPSNFNYQTPTEGQGGIYAANYSGLVTSTTATQTNASLEFLPVATNADATPTTNTALKSAQSLSVDLGASNSNGFHIADITSLDLKLAAAKLFASHGVFYDNTKTENLIKTPVVDLVGSKYDTVHVGDLDYIIEKFSDSYISTGSGRNTVNIGSTENNNYFKLGYGNTKVALDGNGNNMLMGGGANYIEINGSTGKNYVVAGNGPETIKFNGISGFTQISNWNNTQDYLTFGEGINLNDVRLKFNHDNWSYDVFVADKLIANVITTGGLTYADANSIVKPSAYSAPLPYNIQSNTGFLNGLYADAFDAQPDAAGFTFWTNQLNSGATRNSLIEAFLTSPQFNAEHPTLPMYVNAVYKDLLGRPADAAGLNYWTNALSKGLPEVSFVGAVLNSTEFSHLVGGVYN